MALTFRSLFRWMLPGNYTVEDSDGEKLLYSLAMIKDAFDSIAKARLTARFPSLAGESALALIGADRGIPRGRSETAAHYAARLRAWRTPRGHRTRGSGFALLEQIWNYFGGNFALYTVQNNQRRFLRAADGTESSDLPGGWQWDTIPFTKWARFWVVIDGTNLIQATPNFGDPNLYGGAHGNSAYALGHTGVSADDVNAIRRLFTGRAWKPAGTRAEWAVVSLGGTTPTPLGSWGLWARDDGTGHYVATRPNTFRYWALDPTALLYGGDPTKYPRSANLTWGGNYGGNASLFAASSPLVSVASYAGNPANFPLSAKLVDDGSIP